MHASLWILLIAGIATLIFWPQWGLFWHWRGARRGREQILVEDVLKHLYMCEIETRRPTLQSIAGRLQISENQAAQLIQDIQAHGLVQMVDEELQLTPDGRAYALHVVRAHRLWERHLADETGYEETKWHALAEHAEHELTPNETDQLEARLGYPVMDPHGDPIPGTNATLLKRSGQLLAGIEPGRAARIVHLEDEPEAIYAQLVAEGFYPGMYVKVLDRSQQRVRVWAGNDEHLLAPIVAAAITVEPVDHSVQMMRSASSLADLAPPASGRVMGISPRCRGAERRRFLDLGIVPGTLVTAELRGPSGDPTAYRIRDTLFALRHEQAALIDIDRLMPDDAHQIARGR